MNDWLTTLVCDLDLPVPGPALAEIGSSAEVVRICYNVDGVRGRLWLFASVRDKESAFLAAKGFDKSLKALEISNRVVAIGHSLGVAGESGIAAQWLLAVPMSAPPPERMELDRWYSEEHIGLLMRCPHWIRVERYAIDEVVGSDWSRLTLHSLDRRDVLSTQEVRDAMSTPWRNDLASRPWFLAGGRNLLSMANPL